MDEKTDDVKQQESTVTDKNSVASEPTSVPVTTVRDTSKTKPKVLQYLFLLLVIGAIGFGGGWLGARSHVETSSDSIAKQRVVLDEQSDLISQIAKEVGQSVVSVNVTSRTAGQNFGFFGFTPSQEQQSAGTGIILSKEGLVVTNRHVVPEGTSEVSIILSDGTEFDNVEVVGRTSANDTLDIAFLKIKDTQDVKLVPAKIGESSKMAVGESVVAIGNALGQFQNTVTTGIISGYGRSVIASDGTAGGEALDDLFQTDAAINQGNSGGPLVNMDGEIIGINTAVADSAENIGFAIPIDNIKGLIKSVEKTGQLKRPYLGIVYVAVNNDLVKEFDLKVEQGAFIPPADAYGQDTIVDGSPAARAGLKEGDVITKLNGRELTNEVGLASILGQYTPGERIELTVNRKGKTQSLTFELGTMPTGN